ARKNQRSDGANEGNRVAGLTKKEIADKLGLSCKTVLRYLRAEGFFERLKRKTGLG
ncbi:unnamed protein product, partial [marine sediment metagenome]